MLVTEGCLIAMSGDPLADVVWEHRDVELKGSNGEILLKQDDVEVPASWSQLAVRTVVHKYFYGGVGTPERETSVRQMIHRVADAIADWGYDQSYFMSVDERDNFYADLCHILVHQYAAFNSPVWFNVGVSKTPQISACHISSLEDNLASIEDLFKTEMEVFRRGSGNGVNLSNLRGSMEGISGGGYASGPIPFMKALDFTCGAMKSGGKARRGALMRRLDMDHPNIIDFIGLKRHSESIAHALIEAGFNGDWENGIYQDIPWQNANNSVGITDDFMKAYQDKGEWELKARTTGRTTAVYYAEDLMYLIAEAAWTCGCPGVQFHDITNHWHTCKADGEIVCTNPCSEYAFLNDTSCNLASINLMKFRTNVGTFNFELYENVIRTMITAMDILIDVAYYATEKLAVETKKYRTLGLGYANLGTLLMSNGIPYDSKKACTQAAILTSFLTAVGYDQSVTLASQLGAFDRYSANCPSVCDVLKMHAKYAKEIPHSVNTLTSDISLDDDWLHAQRRAYELFLDAAEHPVRNAQISVIAPTGTIGIMMDCDSLGIEPDLALVKYKQIVSGGVEQIVNKSVEGALLNLGYNPHQASAILNAILKNDGDITKVELVQKKHLPVFATALGENTVSWQGHVNMLAAVQPFVSGGVSKTINFPNETTIEQIRDAYITAWEKGIKCIAVYRDGSKGSQPVNIKKRDMRHQLRKKLPIQCSGDRVKLEISGTEIYLHTGCFEDGSLGEIFISAAKSGSTLQGLFNSLAIAISLGLQHGVPLESFTKLLEGQRFDPCGPTLIPGQEHPTFHSSIIDMICAWLKQKYPTTTSIIVDKADNSSNPICIVCGAITQRNGTCFCCANCGTTTGCV